MDQKSVDPLERFRNMHPTLMETRPSILATAEHRHVTAPDGVRISYEVLGQGERTIVLASGAGGRLYTWEPLIEALHRDYRIIEWTYRGLYNSPCSDESKLTMRDHALDALCVLDAEGVRHAAWIGWSMGVQVAFAAASLDPTRVSGLVMLNGTWGHTFAAALQPPGVRFPALERFEHKLLEWLRHDPKSAQILAAVIKRGVVIPIGLLFLLVGRRAIALKPLLDRYVSDATSPETFATYMLLLQELDACSAYHNLPNIQAPTLVVGGQLDPLAPPWVSREMARRLPHGEHLLVRKGTHFVLLEQPEKVVPAVCEFLRHHAMR